MDPGGPQDTLLEGLEADLGASWGGSWGPSWSLLGPLSISRHLGIIFYSPVGWLGHDSQSQQFFPGIRFLIPDVKALRGPSCASLGGSWGAILEPLGALRGPS